MRKIMLLLYLTAVFLILPGCWSKHELTELGFVMGVALDKGKNGKIEMVTQIYRPSSVETGKSTAGGVSSINIKTSDDTVNEAIRDIPIHLGRKAQWSHLRVIIVSDQLAKSVHLGKLLDLFYRDHEPRSSVSLMISKGPAAKLLEKKPLIEQTSAQQFLRTAESGHRDSAKTAHTTLLDFVLQLKSANNDAIVSYVYETKKEKDVISSAGLALLKNGRMKTAMPANKVEGLNMLRNEYKSGIVEFPCKEGRKEMETTEILDLHTKVKPALKDGKVTAVSVAVQGDISIGELKCTDIKTVEDEAAFLRKAEKRMKEQIQEAVTFVQTNKIDVIGIGNGIYRKHPGAWAKMKKSWDKQFSEIPFQIQVKLRLITTGTNIGKPAM